MANKATFWGTEKLPDANYSVYLKKVRYVTSIERMDELQQDKMFQCSQQPVVGPSKLTDCLQWETVKERVIKTGSIDKLLQSLVLPDGEFDARHFNVFFGTYRAFSEPFQVLRHLLKHYAEVSDGQHDSTQPSSDRKRQTTLELMTDTLRSVLIGWLDMYPEDFSDSSGGCVNLCQIMEFSKHHQPHLMDVYDKANKLKHAVRFREQQQQQQQSTDKNNNNSKASTSTTLNNNRRQFGLRRNYEPNGQVYNRALGRVRLVEPGAGVEQVERSLFDADRSTQLFHPLGSIDLLRQLDLNEEVVLSHLVTGRKSDVQTADPVHVAMQLTYWDARMFLQVLPWQCQAEFWSRRHRSTDAADRVASVKATVDQFNALINRVRCSILFPEPGSCQPQYRADVIAKWIEIASELRLLKNYASLKAVLSALASEPVHRLRNVWSLVDKQHSDELQQLMHSFAVSSNHADAGANQPSTSGGGGANASGVNGEPTHYSSPSLTRRALNTSAGGSKEHRRRSPAKRYNGRAKSDMHEVQGCVPYLGTYLTELTAIDEAMPDKDDDGLINFEKYRKEFDVLAKIKLYQCNAKNYDIVMDPRFPQWYYWLPDNMDEQKCYSRSHELEPLPMPHANSSPTIDDNLLLAPDNRKMAKSSTWSKIFGNLLEPSPRAETSEFYAIVPSTDASACPSGRTTPRPPSAVPASGTGSMRKSQSVPPGINRFAEKLTVYNGTVLSAAANNNNVTPVSYSRTCATIGTRGCHQRFQSESADRRLVVLAVYRFGQTDAARYGDFISIDEANMAAASDDPAVYDVAHKFYAGSQFDAAKLNKAQQQIALHQLHPTASCQSAHSMRLPTPKHSITSVQARERDGSSSSVPPTALGNRHSSESTASSVVPPDPQPSQQPTPLHNCHTMPSASEGSRGHRHTQSNGSSGQYSNGSSAGSTSTSTTAKHDVNTHVLRVALDDCLLDASKPGANYKCIKLHNGDKMSVLMERILDKHLLPVDQAHRYALVQLLHNGKEFVLPDKCNPFYAVVSSAADSPAAMLNFILRPKAAVERDYKRSASGNGAVAAGPLSIVAQTPTSAVARLLKRNRNKLAKSNLSRWNSGFL